MDKKEARYLNVKAPHKPVIYQIPKIHKIRHKPPGRPIISDINLLNVRVGEYLDLFLQPLAANGKAFLKDSNNTI